MKLMQRFGIDIPIGETRQQRHHRWSRKNTAYLHSAGAVLQTRNHGVTYLFRAQGKPKVDFYPGTGRWRVAGKKKTFRGGAEAFWNWYNRQ